MSKKLDFDSAHTGQDFYIPVKQFVRLTDKVEKIYEHLPYEDHQIVRTQLLKSLSYLRDGQAVLRAKIKHTLSKAVPYVPEDREHKA